MKYFVIDNGNKIGPFDLVTMIRKIRGGNVTPATFIIEEGSSTPKPASEVPKLSDIFTDDTEDEGRREQYTLRHHSLKKSLKDGWRFFQHNQISTVHTGILIFIVIFLVAVFNLLLPSFLHYPAYILVFILAHFLLSGYMFFVLRMNRGQSTAMSEMAQTLLSMVKPMMIASCLISMLAMVGLVLLIVPGLFVLTIFIFTPFLILDHQYDFWDAMETSRKMVLGSGVENLGIIFALVVINFVAAVFIFLPLLITLPVTVSALAEMYDELFST